MAISYRLIIILLAILIFPFILSFLYRNKEKRDKGFGFVYYGLSYRRRMIRTLWLTPLIVFFIIIYFGLVRSSELKLLASIFILSVFAIQLYYNYWKWNKYERNNENPK